MTVETARRVRQDATPMLRVSSTAAAIDFYTRAFGAREVMRFEAGGYRAELCVPALLNSGNYLVGVWFGTQHEDFLYEPAAVPFTVHGSDPNRAERLVVLNLPLVVRRLNGVP